MTKVFDRGTAQETIAVEDVNLEIPDGTLLVLVGPSGCGKSTTLRCLAGLEDVTSGTVRIDGEDVTHTPPSRRDIAMVFQNYALYPHKTVRGNLAAGLQYSTDLPQDTISDRVRETAQLLNITDLLDKKPKDLSGGQQQRVALGRAIIRDPRVFLFDEPLSNLDAKLRREMRSEIIKLQEDLGVTTIYVTHDQKEAMTMGDKIAVMKDGVIRQTGTPMVIYRCPNSRFVAEFIGSPSMNFCEVKVDDTDSERVEISDCNGELFSFSLSYERLRFEPGSVPSTLEMGIRPEDLKPASRQESSGPTFELPETVRESLGKSVLLHLDHNGKEWVAELDRSGGIREDDLTTFTFRPEDVHLFDEDGASVIQYDRQSFRQ